MVVYGLFLAANFDNVDHLFPATITHWQAIVECTLCRHVHESRVSIPNTKAPKRLIAPTFAMRCRGCGKGGSISVVQSPVKEYTDSETPLIVFDCQDLEIKEWYAEEGWTVVASDEITDPSSDTPVSWTDVDLSEDWSMTVKEQAVSINEVETSVEKILGFELPEHLQPTSDGSSENAKIKDKERAARKNASRKNRDVSRAMGWGVLD